MQCQAGRVTASGALNGSEEEGRQPDCMKLRAALAIQDCLIGEYKILRLVKLKNTNSLYEFVLMADSCLLS
jgi:hypothetical protein